MLKLIVTFLALLLSLYVKAIQLQTKVVLFQSQPICRRQETEPDICCILGMCWALLAHTPY